KAKVSDWRNMMLSYAGRLQLIASILSSMEVYWASVFILPKPKNEGGLGIKDLGQWNEVLMAKNLWNIASRKESLWVKWINEIRIKGGSKVEWRDTIRFSNCTPKHSFIMWMAVQDRLATQEKLMKWYHEKQLTCPLCEICPDSLNHLFFECCYAKLVWKQLKKASDQISLPDRWDDIISTLASQIHNKSIKSVPRRLTLAACVYHIWQERSKRIFTNDKKRSNEVAAEVFNQLRLKLASLTVKAQHKSWKYLLLMGMCLRKCSHEAKVGELVNLDDFYQLNVYDVLEVLGLSNLLLSLL
nr:reverse transcriptase zinc-binding domain-containing protein [Tanacetum cinerariifolium]